MKTYIDARYKGTSRPFTYGRLYKHLSVTHFYMGHRIRIGDASRSREYSNPAEFALDWDVKAVWEEREALRQRKRRED